MNTPEQVLWSILRGGQLDGYRFRRQYPVGAFIVDFFCPAAGLVVEVDGDSHACQAKYDQRRSERLASRKRCQVLRVTNYDVLSNLEGVHDLILKRLHAGPPP
jgi:very-short-patch-repair endonuclease